MANDRHQDRERLRPGERIEVRSGEMRDTDASTTVRRTTSEPLTSGLPAAEFVRHETGRPQRGAGRTAEVEIPEAYNLDQDRVRWGPIIAGLLTALTTLVLLGLLGLAIGLTAVDARQAAAQGGPPAGAGPGSAIWAALSGLLAFLLGGYVAGKTAAIFNRTWGAFNGAMVFFLGVPLILWLASMGLGSMLGMLGTFAGSLNIDPGTVQNTAQNAATQAQQAGQQATPADVGRAAEAVRNGAWGTLLGLGMALGASALGGLLGTRRQLDVNRRTGAVRD